MRKTKNTIKDLVAANLGSSRTRGSVVQQLGSSGVVSVGALPAGSLSIDSAQGAGLSQSLLTSILGTSGSQVSDQVSQLSTALNDLKAAQQAQIDSLTQNTQAVSQNNTKSTGSSVLETAGSVASSLFGGISGLSPIIGGLVSLFGGGSKSNTVTAPTPFSLPSAIAYEGGYSASSGSVTPIDYGQSGTVRSVGGGGTPAATTVQIQVNAMDSKSFLDHSDEIAQAVRQAMLNSSSINDVIADL